MAQPRVFWDVLELPYLACQHASANWRVGDERDPILGACGCNPILQDLSRKPFTWLARHQHTGVVDYLHGQFNLDGRNLDEFNSFMNGLGTHFR
jgi:hypothetical protein